MQETVVVPGLGFCRGCSLFGYKFYPVLSKSNSGHYRYRCPVCCHSSLCSLCPVEAQEHWNTEMEIRFTYDVCQQGVLCDEETTEEFWRNATRFEGLSSRHALKSYLVRAESCPKSQVLWVRSCGGPGRAYLEKYRVTRADSSGAWTGIVDKKRCLELTLHLEIRREEGKYHYYDESTTGGFEPVPQRVPGKVSADAHECPRGAGDRDLGREGEGGGEWVPVRTVPINPDPGQGARGLHH